jgi:hypothetical protein
MDAELVEIYGPFSPIHRVCSSPTVGLDDFCLPPECSSLPDAHEGDVASLEGLWKSISVDGEGFGLAELFVEAPIVPEVDNSTKLCDFLASLASKKQASKSPLQAPLEIPVAAAASVCVPSTVAMEGTQVVSEDPIADKRNAFLSLVFWPLPPPILATPGPRRARAPVEVATTPRRSGRIENRKRKDTTTQELLARTLGLLEENTEFDDNTIAAFNDKFKTPLSPRSITMLGSLVKKMEKVKRPKGRKVDAKKKATEIT